MFPRLKLQVSLKKKDPKITIKKINEMKSNLNGKQEKRTAVKKA